MPAWVDPATGYRSYRASQAPPALPIGLLRSLEVPLPVVAGEWQALAVMRDEAEPARRRRTLAVLERLLADGLPAPQVTVVRDAHQIEPVGTLARCAHAGGSISSGLGVAQRPPPYRRQGPRPWSRLRGRARASRRWARR